MAKIRGQNVSEKESMPSKNFQYTMNLEVGPSGDIASRRNEGTSLHSGKGKVHLHDPAARFGASGNIDEGGNSLENEGRGGSR